MLPKIFIAIVAVSGIIFLISFLSSGPKTQLNNPQYSTQKPEQPEQHNQANESSGFIKGLRPFYSKDGLYLTHSWPGAQFFSNEETEILLFNEGSSPVEVKSFDLEYFVEGKVYPHKSGTWEKFPSKDNHEKIEYINIGANYYKGEKLVLAPGQQGKLHWHINFGPNPLDGKQIVTVKLTLIKDGQTININEQLGRDSGTVFSKEEH